MSVQADQKVVDIALEPVVDKIHSLIGVAHYHHRKHVVKALYQLLPVIQAALAATGKQQVGAFPWENLPAYLIDRCEGDTISEEGIQRAVADMAKDARYCQPQQVGEVQGDALPPMPKCHDRQPDDMPGYMESALDWARNPENCDAVEWLMENHAAIRAALAGRQPGEQEQEPVAYWLAVDKYGVVEFGMWVDDANEGHASRQEVNDFINDQLRDDDEPYHLVGVYAAPPAQGIDLGQVKRDAEIQCLDGFLRMAVEPVGQQCCGRAGIECCGDAIPVYATHNEVLEAMQNRMRELIDCKNDAAPGRPDGRAAPQGQ